jgi:hypothetical protein
MHASEYTYNSILFWSPFLFAFIFFVIF